jgi:lysophospholipase L1-like esterase
MNKLFLFGLFVFALIAMSFISVKKKKKVIFFGDSITEMAVKPKGFISLMNDQLQHDGNSDYELVGKGVSGNKIYDLYLRMDEDVLSQSPDIVVIYIGVNDVWHKKSFGTGTDADKFEKFYRAIIKKIQAVNAKVILVTPAVIGEKYDEKNPLGLDADLDKYSDIVRKIAADNQLPLIDFRKIFMDYEKAHNTDNVEKGILTTDGVHLNDAGNALAAEEMWNTIKEIK